MSEKKEVKEEKKPLNLYQKLIEVRKEVLYVKKEQEGYNFKYATTSEILGAIRPKMDEMGLLLVPDIEEFELIRMKRGNGEIQVPMMKISYTWINAENPEEQIKTSGHYFDDKMTGSQGVGSIMTYAERYFLYKFFQVATDKDSPEEYYKKHELTAAPEVVPLTKEESPIVEKKPKFYPNFEKCKKLATIVWISLRQIKTTLPENPNSDLSYYLYKYQENHPHEDVMKTFSRPCKDVDAFLQKVSSWAMSEDGRYEMEEISIREYEKREELQRVAV